MKGLSAYLELKENYKGARSLIKEQDDIIKMYQEQIYQLANEAIYLKSEISSLEREKEKLKQAYFLDKEI